MRSHAAPRAEGTLVRDMRNVKRNSGTERLGWLTPPGTSGLWLLMSTNLRNRVPA